MCLFRCRFYTTVGDARASGRCPVEVPFNSKTRLPKVPSADEFFGVTNLEVKLLYPIVPLIGILVGDFRGMHEKVALNPRVLPIRQAQRVCSGVSAAVLDSGFRQPAPQQSEESGPQKHAHGG